MVLSVNRGNASSTYGWDFLLFFVVDYQYVCRECDVIDIINFIANFALRIDVESEGHML
jgi:hypothetical protein